MLIRTPPFPFRVLRPAALLASFLAATCAALALPGCDRLGLGSSSKAPTPTSSSQAEAGFATLAAACTQFLATRTPQVAPHPQGGWAQTGTSAAQVTHEVTRTDSPITPYVGKIVIKDNVAQARAATEAEARAIVLTPAHLISNRTHTFVYRFDGTMWHWNNGSLLTKAPPQDDVVAELGRAQVAAPGSAGFAACLPP